MLPVSSRLVGADEEGTIGQLKAHRAALFDAKLAEHHGRLVKTTGDGLLAEFASVVDAVRCAVDVQRGMAARNADVAPDRRIEFRIGVHVGDIIVEDDDIFGEGVNVAARLEGLAAPGGICVSARVQEDVEGRLDVGFADEGEQQLKNIARPVRVHRVLLGGAEAEATPVPAAKPADPSVPDRLSIAVLPFQNMSADPDQDYFADGMVEDIITGLSHYRHIFVIARNSTFTYKGRAVDVKQVGRDLGVRFVLEGSVRKAGSRIRITGQLIDTATAAHIWAERFEGGIEDIFDLAGSGDGKGRGRDRARDAAGRDRAGAAPTDRQSRRPPVPHARAGEPRQMEQGRYRRGAAPGLSGHRAGSRLTARRTAWP